MPQAATRAKALLLKAVRRLLARRMRVRPRQRLAPATSDPVASGLSLGGTTSTEKTKKSRANTEPPLVRWILTLIALAFLGLFLVVPVAIVFIEAFKKGTDVYLASIREPDALAAIKLTLLTTAIAVPLNTLFGLAAAWGIAKFRFRGKSILITLIDLPFAVSPVIAGLIFVLLLARAASWGRGSKPTIGKSSSPCRVSCSPPRL
jgi:sulfate transport system permease protein